MEKFAGLHKAAITCDEARKAEHPMTKCVKDQGKKFSDPYAYCQWWLTEKCDYPPGARPGAKKSSAARKLLFASIFLGTNRLLLRNASGYYITGPVQLKTANALTDAFIENFESFLHSELDREFEIPFPQGDSLGRATVTLWSFMSPEDLERFKERAYSTFRYYVDKLERNLNMPHDRSFGEFDVDELIQGVAVNLLETNTFEKMRTQARAEVTKAINSFGIEGLAGNSSQRVKDFAKNTIHDLVLMSLNQIERRIMQTKSDADRFNAMVDILNNPSAISKILSKIHLLVNYGAVEYAASLISNEFHKFVRRVFTHDVFNKTLWTNLTESILNDLRSPQTENTPSYNSMLNAYMTHAIDKNDRFKAAFKGTGALEHLFNASAYLSRTVANRVQNVYNFLYSKFSDVTRESDVTPVDDDGTDRMISIFDQAAKDSDFDWNSFVLDYEKYLQSRGGTNALKTFQMLSEGFGKKEISRHLRVSPSSITKYLATIRDTFVKFIEQNKGSDQYGDLSQTEHLLKKIPKFTSPTLNIPRLRLASLPILGYSITHALIGSKREHISWTNTRLINACNVIDSWRA